MEYRVYDKANKRYMDVVQICYAKSCHGSWLRPGVVGLHGHDHFLVAWEDAVLEACTGKRDGKGQIIYEGHIVRGVEAWQRWDHIGVVEYSSSFGGFVLNIPGNTDIHRMVLLHDYDSLDVLGDTAHQASESALCMRFYGDEGYDDADTE